MRVDQNRRAAELTKKNMFRFTSPNSSKYCRLLVKSPLITKFRNLQTDNRGRPTLCNPFHIAIPVHCIHKAREFYGGVLELAEGRRSENKWQDYSLFGNQLVCHYVGEKYRASDYYNPGRFPYYIWCQEMKWIACTVSFHSWRRRSTCSPFWSSIVT